MELMRPENLPIVVSLVPSLAIWAWLWGSRRRDRAAADAEHGLERPWPRRTFEDGLLSLCLVFLAPLGVVLLLPGGGGAEGPPSAGRLALISVAQAVVVGCVAWAFRPKPVRRSDGTGSSDETGLETTTSPIRRRDVTGLAVALGWAGLAPCFLVNGLVIVGGLKASDESHPLLRMLAESPGSEFVVLLGVCLAAGVCAPVVEEIQFRHALQGWLSSVWGSRAGLWIVALLFAGVHYSPGRPDAIPLFPFALILGWLYARHRSLAANIVCHATFNLLNIAIAVAQNWIGTGPN
jgi:membrane protease YdiL (CAAX protease family)